MSKIATLAFLGNAETVITLNRALTADEINALGNVKTAALTAGRQTSPHTMAISEEGVYSYTSFWSDISDANAYVAVANGFTPAPTSATATAV